MWPQPVLNLLAAAGDRPVFEDGDRIVSAAVMSAMIRRCAAGLRARGIGPRDGVLFQVGVHPEALAGVLAAFTVGARVACVRADQVAEVLPDADAVLIDEAALAELAGHPDDGAGLVAAGHPGDYARVIYTSGSTGTPKGCCQTYAAMTAGWAAHPNRWPPAVRALAARLDRYLVFGSLTSQVMLEYGVLTLAAGGTLVAAHPPAFPEAFAKHRATASVITVGRLHQLVRDQRNRPADLSTLRALMVSGSPLDPGRLAEAIEVLGPVIFHGYGQTETGMISMATPGEFPAALGTVGRPAVEVRVRDGELYVRAPAQACSYWHDPAGSAEVFLDGWVRTRDLGTVGADGYLRLTGRARDVIFVHAELIHAGPIERLLAGHPDVAEAYVVARPDDETGEAPHAYVVPAAGRRPDPRELRELVTGPGRPRTVTVIDRVPVAPSGKPDKEALRRLSRTTPL